MKGILLTYHDPNHNTQFKRDLAIWFLSKFECGMDRQ